MTINYALFENLEVIEKKSNGEHSKAIVKANTIKLIACEIKTIIEVEYEGEEKIFKENVTVVIDSGGFGANFSANSPLQKYRT